MPVTIDPLAPAEAAAYWKGKAPVSAEDFKRMEAAARSRAFAVSGLARMDQVQTVQNALGKAITDGESLADFKNRIGGIIEQQGWTGKKAWRVENIFRTNMQSAYMAGRFEQMKRVAKARPYWKLVAVRDRRTRQTHLAVDGLVFPHDHPFWDTWYPPNGFACRCVVVTLSKRQVKGQGLTVQTEMPDTIRVVDPATGMESFVTPLPDKGWATNVGKDWLSGLAPSERDGTVKDLNIGPFCRSGEHASGTSCKPSLKALDPRHVHRIGQKDILPTGLPDKDYVMTFLKQFGLKDINASKVHTLPGGIPVVISKEFFVKDKSSGKGWKVAKGGREQFIPLLAKTILDPFEIWQTTVKVGANSRPCLNLLRLFADDSGTVGGYGVFHLIGGRKWSAATVFTPKTGQPERDLYRYLEKKRNGVLVYREP